MLKYIIYDKYLYILIKLKERYTDEKKAIWSKKNM